MRLVVATTRPMGCSTLKPVALTHTPRFFLSLLDARVPPHSQGPELRGLEPKVQSLLNSARVPESGVNKLRRRVEKVSCACGVLLLLRAVLGSEAPCSPHIANLLCLPLLSPAVRCA